jgi:hypothetical protein
VPEVDPSRLALFVLAGAALLHGCGAASPCRGSAWCEDGAVCGLAGACVPRPSVDATRFVEVTSLPARRARTGDGALPDRWSLGGPSGEPVELRFGPLPAGEVTSAVLRVFPYPGASGFDGEAVAVVRRGRHRATVRHAVGAPSPLLVDVTPLVRGLEAGASVVLVLDVRSRLPFEAASSRIADPARRPTLELVTR